MRTYRFARPYERRVFCYLVILYTLFRLVIVGNVTYPDIFIRFLRECFTSTNSLAAGLFCSRENSMT